MSSITLANVSWSTPENRTILSGLDLAFARERMAKAGLADRVELKFQDYRDETGTYDRIVSIDGVSARGQDTTWLVSHLRGKIGTTVSLEVERGDGIWRR